jgi:hypothetical protein
MALLKRSSTVPKSFLPGKKEFYNLPSTTTAPPAANAYGVRPWQLSGLFTTTAEVSMPFGAPGITIQRTLIVPINSGWPSPVILKPTDLGSILVSISQAAAAPTWLIGMPEVQMQWAAGTAITPSSGASQFTLSPGTTYSGPALHIVVTGYHIASSVSIESAFLTVQANLYGNSTT